MTQSAAGVAPATAAAPPGLPGAGEVLDGDALVAAPPSPFWMKPLEAVSAALMLNITVLLLVGVISS